MSKMIERSYLDNLTGQPEARCQSCFTPAKLYPALNTRLCVKCLAIIATSILDSGLADEINARAQREQREKDAAIVRQLIPIIRNYAGDCADEATAEIEDCAKEIESDGQ